MVDKNNQARNLMQEQLATEKKRASFQMNLFWILFGTTATILTIVALIFGINFNFIVFKLNLAIPLVILTVLYLASSLKIVKSEEQGVIRFLGAIVKKVNPGLVFVPPVVSDLIKVPSIEIQFELNTKTGKIVIDDPNQPDLAASRTVVYKSGNGPGAYSQPIHSSPSWAFRLKFKDVERSIKILGPNMILKAVSDIAEIAISINQEYAGKNTYEDTLGKIEELSRKVLRAIEWHIGEEVEEDQIPKNAGSEQPADWGIDLTKVSFTDHGLPEQVLVANAELAASASNAEAEKRRADASAYRIEKEGASQAGAEMARLEAREAVINKGQNGQMASEHDVAKEALKGSKPILVGDSILRTIGSVLGKS